MKKIKLLIVLLVFIIATGCASKAYNVPFVDTEETLALNPGMSKEEVLGVMNEPLYVELGDSETGLIHWVYEVRSNDVLSDLMKTGQVVPNKIHKTRKSTAPLHHIKLTFKDGSLTKWTILNYQDTVEEEKGEQETTEKKKKKKYKFFATPKLSFHNMKYDFTPEPRYYQNWDYIDNGESYEDCGDDYEYYEYWNGDEGCMEEIKNESYIYYDKQAVEYDPILFGLNIGVERNNTRLGLDLQGFDSGMFFLKLEQRNMTMFGVNVAISLGFFDFSDSYTVEYITYDDDGDEYEAYVEEMMFDYDYYGLASIGVGKQFSIGPLSIEPSLNLLYGEYIVEGNENYTTDEEDNYSYNWEDGNKFHPYLSIAFGLNKLK